MPTSHAAVVSQEHHEHPDEGPPVPQVFLPLPSNPYGLMYAATRSILLYLVAQCLGLIALTCHSHGHHILQSKYIHAAATEWAIAVKWLSMLQLRMEANALQHVLHHTCIC